MESSCRMACAGIPADLLHLGERVSNRANDLGLLERVRRLRSPLLRVDRSDVWIQHDCFSARSFYRNRARAIRLVGSETLPAVGPALRGLLDGCPALHWFARIRHTY